MGRWEGYGCLVCQGVGVGGGGGVARTPGEWTSGDARVAAEQQAGVCVQDKGLLARVLAG